MTIKVHRVWSWSAIVIYGAGWLFCLAISGWAAWALKRGDDRPWQPALLLPFVWSFIVWRRGVTRKAFIDSIAWVTRDGLSVIPGDAKDWLATRRTDFDQVVDQVVNFWCEHFADEHDFRGEELISNFLNGMVVVVHVQAGPIVDQRHGISARGMFWPGEVHIQVSPADPGAQMWALLGHELSHAAMTAMGVPANNAAQHAVMADSKCPWR